MPDYQWIVSGTIEGFLIDFQPKSWRKFKQSGYELYFMTEEGNYFAFFAVNDPYFYVVLEDRDREAYIKERLLSIGKSFKGFQTIKKLEKKMSHVWGSFNDHFYHLSPVERVTAYYPGDIPKLRMASINIPGIDVEENVRESKVLYHIRGMIDFQMRVGKFYECTVIDGFLGPYKEIETGELPSIKDICVFDTEIRKAPVKKPRIGDPLNLLGYKHRGDGFMVNNLSMHGNVEFNGFWLGVKDEKVTPIPDDEVAGGRFKYAPLYFSPVNVKDETGLLRHWKNFLENKDPLVICGYYSDSFDWKMVVENGKLQRYPVSFDDYFEPIFRKSDYPYKRRGQINIDAIDFIRRDSYLSKGNQGLKDVAKILLRIEPLEIDHEETVKILDKINGEWTNPEHPGYDLERARDEVQHLAYYCASDVYVTSILLEDHVINLDFSLSSIMPLTVNETARNKRGSMIDAMVLDRMQKANIIAPNKITEHGKFFFNPVEEVLGNKKEVFYEIKVAGKKKWARCINTKVIKESCAGCDKQDRCSLLVMGASRNKHFTCDKNGDYLIGMKKSNLPVTGYKFEGAYVDVFNNGIFKDNCPITFELDDDVLKKMERKMTRILLINARRWKKDGMSVPGLPSYIKMISDGFDHIRNKCLIKENGFLEYSGLISIVHVDVSSMYPSLIINYNLQPNGVVKKLTCLMCTKRSKEGETPCWIELPWNAVYEVVMIPQKVAREVEKALKRKQGSEKDREKLAKKMLESFVKKGTVKRPKKINGIYKVKETARFCQKADKFFVDMVSDFRAKRYKYKYGERDVGDEMERIRTQWKDTMPLEMKEQLSRLQEEISARKETVSKLILVSKSEMVSNDQLIALYSEISSFQKKLGKFVEEWMERIPDNIRKELNELSVKKIFNRNAQLTYKVILNAIYGWLKSVGARLWSIEVTGCTTMSGQRVIMWVVDYTKGACLPAELDTDGAWILFPVDFPLEIKVRAVSKDGENKTMRLNLFNSIVNDDVKGIFSNRNNYEWDEVEKCFVNIPKNEIKFDYDGPYSTLIIQGMKRYVVYERDDENPTKQNLVEMKGMDKKRKGELGMLKELEGKVFDSYREGTNYNECYGGVAPVAKKYLTMILNGTMALEMIIEARDIKDVSKVVDALDTIKDLEKKGKYNTSKIPVSAWFINASSLSTAVKKKLSILKEKSINMKHAIGCLRMGDMGIDIENGETVRWIVTKYPLLGKKKSPLPVSQRVIPINLFDASDDEIRHYLKRWIGHELPVDFSMETVMHSLIDWNHYRERFTRKFDKIVLQLYRNQKQYVTFDLFERVGITAKGSDKNKGKGSLLGFVRSNAGNEETEDLVPIPLEKKGGIVQSRKTPAKKFDLESFMH
jgi:DNA polymerase epsilon subunit 1